MDLKNQMEWDRFFLGMAFYVSKKSKDPSTKVGACIAKKKSLISIGYNGPPAKVNDSPNLPRDKKLARTIHAEPNAMFAARGSLKKCSLYVTHYPCSNCAAMIIQKRIKRVVCPTPTGEFRDRWAASMQEATDLFNEAGVTIVMIDGDFNE